MKKVLPTFDISAICCVVGVSVDTPSQFPERSIVVLPPSSPQLVKIKMIKKINETKRRFIFPSFS
jgi:hypothetical protein